MVCALINNNICHHSGQNVVELWDAAQWFSKKFWLLWWQVSLLIRIQTMLDCFWFVFIPLTILISNKTVFLVWEMMKTMIKALWDVLMQAVLSVLLLTTANWLVRLWHYCQLWWKVATSGVSVIDFPMSEEKSSCILRWRSIYQLLLKSISWLTYWLLQLWCACTCKQSGNLWMYSFKE